MRVPSQTHSCPACKQNTGKLVMDLNEEHPLLSHGDAHYVCTNNNCQCQFCVTPGGLFSTVRPRLIPVEQDNQTISSVVS